MEDIEKTDETFRPPRDKKPKAQYEMWAEADFLAEGIALREEVTMEFVAERMTRALREQHIHTIASNYFCFFTDTGQLIIHWSGDDKTTGKLFFSIREGDSPPVPCKQLSITFTRKGKVVFACQRMIKNPFDPQLDSLILTSDDLCKAENTDHFIIWALRETK